MSKPAWKPAPIRAAGAVVFSSLFIVGCGRSPTSLTNEQPDLHVPPIRDGWTGLDAGVDGRLPPPIDGWTSLDAWPPPPPVDGWPPIPDAPQPPPPPFDMWPPPYDGPCSATCTQKCQLLKQCNLLPGGVGQCANQQCPLWPPNQSLCLGNLVCFPPPTPDICPLVQKCIATTQQPDLVITGFKAAVSGTTVTYSITVCNQGKGPAGNFFVDVYYDRQSPPGLKDFGNRYKQYPNGLAAGACDTAVLIRYNASAGTSTSWAQVDTDGIVAETNEQNNVAGPLKVTIGGTPPPKGPDLVIKSMEASVLGSTSISVRYKLEICNNGTDAAGGAQVHVYYDRTSAPPQGLPGDQFTTVPGLQPGGCSTRYVYRSGTPQGSYTSWAQVDPQNQVQETNETNNTAGPVKVLVGTSPGADLTIKTFDHQLFGASTVRYRMQVCNVGTGSSGATAVHVYFNRTTAPTVNTPGDQYTTVQMLTAGQCVNRYVYRTGTPSGSFTSWAQVDPYNQIKETSETNNVAGPIKVTVGSTTQKPDLTFKSFDAQVVQGPAGNLRVQYAMVVCNVGTGPATGFRVDVYYNRASAPSVSQLGNAHQNVLYLGPSGCTSIIRYNNNPQPGSYSSWAQVDTTQNVAETNESNNVAGPKTVTVGITPPPPPPPQPCPDLCNFVINTCNYIPSSQYAACVAGCEALTPDKITCLEDAMNKKQCSQVLSCLP
jgi:subtilase family serine protease